MGQVIVTGPNNGEPVDGTAMKALLGAIALGINNIDGTQLANGSVSEATILDEQVSLAKLKAGQFLRYASILDAGGLVAPSDLILDGAAGTTHGPKLIHNVWAPLRTGVYGFRVPGGDVFSITPPQNCYAVFFGSLRTYFYTPSAGNITQVYTVLWDENAGVVTDVNNHFLETQTEEMNDTAFTTSFSLLGMAALTEGVSYRPVPAAKVIMSAAGVTTCNTKLYIPTKNSWVGCLLLPR